MPWKDGAYIEERSLRPGDIPITPNDNPDIPPSSVGVPAQIDAGEVGALEIVEEGTPSALPASILTASRWDGWPAEWYAPLLGRVADLTDIAWTCVDLNSSLLATMPPYLVGAAPSLSADWLTNPDPDLYTSWEEFAKQLFWDYQLGEAFVMVTARYATGWPARFHVVDPWLINIDWVDGRRRYDIGGVDVTGDLLHIRYKSSTGDAHGHGPLEAGRDRVIAASLLMRYATNLVVGGGIPNSVLTSEDQLTDDQATTLQNQWVEARMSSMGLPAVLSGGITFDVLQFSPQDMALLDLAQHNESRIAVSLGVPPFLVGLPSGGDSMTYSNVISLFDYHWRAGLRPKAQAVMAALSGWLLPRGTTVEVNRDAYVQPDPTERATMWATLITHNVVTAEEVRRIERYDSSADFVATGVL